MEAPILCTGRGRFAPLSSCCQTHRKPPFAYSNYFFFSSEFLRGFSNLDFKMWALESVSTTHHSFGGVFPWWQDGTYIYPRSYMDASHAYSSSLLFGGVSTSYAVFATQHFYVVVSGMELRLRTMKWYFTIRPQFALLIKYFTQRETV